MIALPPGCARGAACVGVSGGTEADIGVTASGTGPGVIDGAVTFTGLPQAKQKRAPGAKGLPQAQSTAAKRPPRKSNGPPRRPVEMLVEELRIGQGLDGEPIAD